MIREVIRFAKPAAFSVAAAVCLALAVALEAAARALEEHGNL